MFAIISPSWIILSPRASAAPSRLGDLINDAIGKTAGTHEHGSVLTDLQQKILSLGIKIGYGRKVDRQGVFRLRTSD